MAKNKVAQFFPDTVYNVEYDDVRTAEPYRVGLANGAKGT